MSRTPTPERITLTGLLRSNRNFRCVWLAELTSMFGDWFSLIASVTLIARLTGSTAAGVGAMFLIRLLAPILVSPWGGLIADRANRRTLMVLSDLLRAIVALGFLFIQHPHQIWILYVLTAVQAAVGGVFHPARSAMLPAVVSRSELATANSLSSINFALMQALGSGIGGLAVGVIGVYPTFVVDSATFVVSGILSLCVPARLGRPRPDGGSGEPREHRSLRADVRDGLHYMRSDVEVTLLALHKGANALTISGGLNVLSVSIAQTRFPLGADGGVSVGLLLCATGVGTGIGPVLARGLMRDSEPRMRYLLGLSYIVSSLGMMLIAPMIGMSLVVVGLIIRAIGGGMMFMMTNQLLALRVPGHLRGRIFSVDFAARNLGGALGIVLVSAMIEGGTSIERTTWTLAVMGLVPGVLWLWWTWHRQAHHADTPAVRGA